MNKVKELKAKQARRAKRVRAKLFGTAQKPRLSVFRSNKYISAQAIDDDKGKTILSGSTRDITEKGNKTERAALLGALIAEKAKKAGIDSMIFDRGQYRYHGRVKSVAEGARNAGINL